MEGINKDTPSKEIVLISEYTIQSDTGTKFYIKETIGYLYAEEELNRICSIYGHGVGQIQVKHLHIIQQR